MPGPILCDMQGAQRSKRKSVKPGLRALEGCGDGFWEFDLLDGSAWFNDWFYQKLAWPTEVKRTTLADLQPVVAPQAWSALMANLREHLERGAPLDVELEINLSGNERAWWRIRGSAHRNGAGQPVSIAGSMQDVSADRRPAEHFELLRLRGAFESLPVAAALLDARATVLESNRLWQDFSHVTVAQALARLRAANSQTAIEFWLDQGEEYEAGARQLRVRAIAFQHDGARHLAVTLEDRRSD
jgi:PAS domain-containing protein